MSASNTITQTILIVDDHPSFLAAARLMLETEGFDVVGVATEGEAAVAETLRLAPDVVLIDVALPRHRRLRGRPPAACGGCAERDRPHLEPRRRRLRPADRGVGSAGFHQQT
jgi:CheY-like chemotaxis protein